MVSARETPKKQATYAGRNAPKTPKTQIGIQTTPTNTSWKTKKGLYEEGVDDPLHSRHSRQLGPVGMDLVPGEFAAARVDVDVGRGPPALPLPEPAAGPEEEDDGHGEVGLEEALGIVVSSLGGADGDVELGEEKR